MSDRCLDSLSRFHFESVVVRGGIEAQSDLIVPETSRTDTPIGDFHICGRRILTIGNGLVHNGWQTAKKYCLKSSRRTCGDEEKRSDDDLPRYRPGTQAWSLLVFDALETEEKSRR